jgi:PIN domain nuclease of toxin-antitoxin system
VIVLDTHAWLWWWSDARDELSPVAIRAIDEAEVLGIPALSCFEIVQADRKKRAVFDRDVRLWIEQSLSAERVRVLPVTPEIAIGAARLLWDHRDPFDRIIVATALIHRAPLVTRDDRIRRFGGVPTIW